MKIAYIDQNTGQIIRIEDQRSLSDAKNQNIQKCRNAATDAIANAGIDEIAQKNAALGVYEYARTQAIKQFINDCRTEFLRCKDLISSAKTNDDADLVVFNSPQYIETERWTAEAWLTNQTYTPLRLLTCLDLESQLADAQKFSPKLADVRTWLNTITVMAAPNPDTQKSNWPKAPWGFADVSAEAIALLN